MVKTKDGLPEPRQYISAKLRDGSIVPGMRSASEANVVWFDFYGGTGAEVYAEWEPREVTGKSSHPWTPIIDGCA